MAVPGIKPPLHIVMRSNAGSVFIGTRHEEK